MKTTAKDLMATRFHTVTPRMPVNEAVNAFQQACTEEGRKIFGMMVVNEEGHLTGMISMYDILLFMRPKHTHIWGRMDDIDTASIMDVVCEKTRTVFVGDIMTTELVTITPDTHILLILDIMIKKHVRRLPVLEGEEIKGIVYISDVFYNLLDRFAV